jgi:hypothetical protein
VRQQPGNKITWPVVTRSRRPRIRRSQDEVERGELLDEDEVRALVANRRMPEK